MRYSLTEIIIHFLFLVLILSGCQTGEKDLLPPGDPDNGGLILPDGFEAVVVADSIGRARHLAVNGNGDIYVKLRVPDEEGRGLAALRDRTADGKADLIEYFGDYPDEGNYGTGMRIYNDHIYFSTAGVVFRQKLTPGELVPESKTDVILTDDYMNAEHGYEHVAKPITFDGSGNMYIPFGSPGDVCQDPNRTPGVPGQDPCPELERHGGIWKFDANQTGQIQDDGIMFATGIRSVVAMDWNPLDEELYVVQHGRDNLHTMWPVLYSPWDNAMLPSEQFMRVTENSDFGWPYCYHDQMQDKKLLNPEYGGDGTIVGRCSEFEDPLFGFPGHFAPNDLHFYHGDQFPARYKNGAFVAFHGSTIRAPYPQAGYFVAFIPFENGEPTGDWEVFANGFAGVDPIVNTRDAKHRPMGLATGPDGTLYIIESVQGKIWRIMFTGDKDTFGEEHLEGMEREKQTASNIRTPHEIDDNLEIGTATGGELIYFTYCAACHQRDGEGSPPRFPPLAGTDWVTGDKERLISIILNGLEGPIEVRGETYNFPMPAFSILSDEEVAEVATYIRQSFGNEATSVTADEVSTVRKKLEHEEN
jgi:glucose/arabinose dehydrogenase/mono/diheme cytochrome c family protein